MNTTENNTKIAKFLGYEITDGHQGKGIIRQGQHISLNKLKFHNDWNWLMEAVEVIEKMEFKERTNTTLYYDFVILPDAIIIQRNDNEKTLIVINKSGVNGELYEHETIIFDDKKTSIYWAILTFAEWYNKNGKQK